MILIEKGFINLDVDEKDVVFNKIVLNILAISYLMKH